MNINETLKEEFSLKDWQLENTVKLIDDDNTIPFIARYRKEMTGGLDDQLLRSLYDRLLYLRNLEEQKNKVRESIESQGALTEEIISALESAATVTEVEDIYRPYRPKRKTRASVAKEKGLEPLANILIEQSPDCPEPTSLAEEYINAEKGVESVIDALAGARDIIAEMISDDANIRKRLRVVVAAHGLITTKQADDEIGVYEMYADYKEPISRIANHRVLAINRGENEKKLKVSVDFEKERGLNIIFSTYLKAGSKATGEVTLAIEDAYTRLIFPAIEREIRNQLTDRASEDAIKVFSENLRHLLMQPPLKNKVTIGLDPGYRTGCKVAVVDGTGRVLDTAVIYPVPPHNKIEEAKKIISNLVKKWGAEIFAIGNGTASHETEEFAANLIKELNTGLSYLVVSEAGASVYSASKLAAAEFPEYDVSLRSAVSIARRLQDPLAELVKIDPKAIGIGQYQHDMPQNRLAFALDGVVESCVNSVGVDLNTASAPLLERISGISSAVAKNIVSYREENGEFTSRTELNKVAKLGPKAFTQSAGFLRIIGGKNPLDSTAVHPESYSAAKKLIEICGYTDKEIVTGGLSDIESRVEKFGLDSLAEKLGIGSVTLKDIAAELSKPGRDPREALPPPLLRTDIMSMEDLKTGMELTGTVRNVIDFGAFIDIGVHQDGLVHISHITDRFIKHPSAVLKVGDRVKVWVLGVDAAKKRISLTMRQSDLGENKNQ